MSTIPLTPARLFVSEETIKEARHTKIPTGATLLLQSNDGHTVPLTENVQQMLLQALSSVAENGEVTIGGIPEHLTSTSAADMIGISRPTLMKWARTGKIASFKIGTHTRFSREEVLRVKEEHEDQRKKATQEFRSFAAKYLDELPD